MESDTSSDTESADQEASKNPMANDVESENRKQVKKGELAIELIHANYLNTFSKELGTGEGFRFGALGETGTGKSYLIKRVIKDTVKKKISYFCFAHDTKSLIPEYPESSMRVNIEHFRQTGFLRGEPPFISFRGDAIKDVECPVEDVASFVLERARTGIKTDNGNWRAFPLLFCIDEISEACTPAGKGWKSESALKTFTQGRKMGLSVVWTTQTPRRVPFDVTSQSSHVALFRLSAQDRNYVRNIMELDEKMVSILDELPNHHFVIWEKAKPWNGEIYKL